MDYVEIIEIIKHYEDQPVIRVPRIYLMRDATDPFVFYNDAQFKSSYRFSKGIVRYIITPLIYQELSKPNQRGLPILPINQIFVAFRFYATGSFQIVGGDLGKISQPIVSPIIKRVSEAIARHLLNCIQFPQRDSKRTMIRRFYEVANFAAISSCVDGTQIIIKNPGGDVREIFRNRKANFSLNVQVACGLQWKY